MPNGASPPTCPVQHATPPGFFAAPASARPPLSVCISRCLHRILPVFRFPLCAGTDPRRKIPVALARRWLRREGQTGTPRGSDRHPKRLAVWPYLFLRGAPAISPARSHGNLYPSGVPSCPRPRKRSRRLPTSFPRRSRPSKMSVRRGSGSSWRSLRSGSPRRFRRRSTSCRRMRFCRGFAAAAPEAPARKAFRGRHQILGQDAARLGGLPEGRRG